MRIDEKTYKAMPAHLQALFRAEPNPARDEVLAAFPQAKGQQGALTGSEPSSKTANAYGEFAGRAASGPRGDIGSAARFFYCAKASKRDRDEGLEGFEKRVVRVTEGHGRGEINTSKGGDGIRENRPRANIHPTVKPTDLMRYLCRLVTPPGGIVLDPFMGSGSTGKAAVLEGFGFIGMEIDEAYAAIARARIAASSPKPVAKKQDAQPDLFDGPHDDGIDAANPAGGSR